jgi:hypothetical protein
MTTKAEKEEKSGKRIADFIEACEKKDFSKTIEELQQLFREATPDSLTLYQRIESLKIDISTSSKTPELMANSAIQLYKEMISQRLDFRDRLGQVALSLLLFVLLPFLPLIVFLLSGETVSSKDEILTITLFCITIALTFNDASMMAALLVVAFLPALFWSTEEITTVTIYTCRTLAFLSAGSFFVLSWTRHMVQHERVFKTSKP